MARNVLISMFVASVLLYVRNTHVAPVPSPPAWPAPSVATPSIPSQPRADVASPASEVTGTGIVVRLLSDDLQGDRHQRFILRRPDGRTLLVAHNIDVAPRVTGLRVGDAIAYKGEFEPNPQGGVVHWTHRDPSGRHEAGWLKHDGQVFE